MAIWIKIIFRLKENDTYYYEVDTQDIGEAHFFINLNPKNKHITYLEDLTSRKVMKTIDLRNEDELIQVPGIHPAISVRVFSKAKKALEKNEFPQYLDYCA